MNEHRSVFIFHCPLCNWSITLPRLSPLGSYEGTEYRPSALWPIVFLCAARQQTSECSSNAIEAEEIQPRDKIETPAALWQIAGECGQETCRSRSAVYTWYLANATPEAVVKLALELNPKVSCLAGHDLEWKAETMEAMRFEY
jgi:hypothetical protein